MMMVILFLNGEEEAEQQQKHLCLSSVLSLTVSLPFQSNGILYLLTSITLCLFVPSDLTSTNNTTTTDLKFCLLSFSFFPLLNQCTLF